MKPEPLVSILMTAYNREDYISEAIQSVLNSTYKNFELIIVDDCSTDQTYEIANKFCELDNRVTLYRNEFNLKDYPNRNEAASHASGKYIKYLDSDDTIFQNGLEYCVNAMESFPDAGMAIQFFQKEYIGHDPLCWTSNKIIKHQFFVRGCLNVGPSGTMFRRDVFESLGGFDVRFGVASDNYFNIYLASKYSVVLLPAVFFFYRVHDNQEIKDKLGYLKYNHLYLKELVDNGRLPLSSDELQVLRKRVELSFAKQLVHHLIETKSILSTVKLIKDSKYSFANLLKSIAN